jgi:hypothetical protein
MHRRDLLKLGLAVLPATIPAAWAQQAAKPDWRPSVLDDHQNETVIVLTELIIPATDTPGAKAAPECVRCTKWTLGIRSAARDVVPDSPDATIWRDSGARVPVRASTCSDI